MRHFRGVAYLIFAGALLLLGIWSAQVTGSTWGPGENQPGNTVPTRTPGPPEPLQITLKATLQRPNASPPHPSWAIPVRFTVHPLGNAVIALYTWDLLLDQNGTWQGVLMMVPDTYDLRLKNAHTLRNVKRSVVVANGVTIDMGLLQEGDADDDNRVRSADFGILRSAYFTSEGETGFDPRADFDEDNRIRASDFALLRSNYFETGDLEVTAAMAGADMQPAALVDLALEPARVQVAPGETFTLTFIARAGTQPFVALDADIRFPAALLQVVGPDGQPATEVQPLPPVDFLLKNQVNNTTGQIKYAAGVDFTSPPVAGTVPLAYIRFKALQAAPAAEIRLVDGGVSDEDGKYVTGLLLGATVRIGNLDKFLYQPMIYRTN